MKSLPVLSIILLFNFYSSLGQVVRISGSVINDEDKKAVSGAQLILKPDGLQFVSDMNGLFSINTTPGKKELTIKLLGYKTQDLQLNLISDSILDIFLTVSPINLKEVVISESTNAIKTTEIGSYIITPASIKETPKLFSEPDLLNSLQFLPGVIPGKEGTTDLYVRGGGTGQNIVLVDGCYFFLPGHLLGIVSPYDLDFLESAELYKDYLPSEIGGGASSVINIEFRKPRSDSLGAQLRLGLLSSGIIIETPLCKNKLQLTVGLKRGNYDIYAPILKKIVSDDVQSFLPPDKYRFYDGFLRFSYDDSKIGNLSYTFFGNYDNGKNESVYKGLLGDTINIYKDGLVSGWNSMVHTLQWKTPIKGPHYWKFNLNYNRLAIGRKIYSESEAYINNSQTHSSSAKLSFFPSINNIGASAQVIGKWNEMGYSVGISNRFRVFAANTYAESIKDGIITKNNLGEDDFINESTVFISSSVPLKNKVQLDAGMRFSLVLIKNADFITAEPRIRISYNTSGMVSPHINYVRLSQNDHSIEGSNAGLRNMLWLPLFKDFGPESSDIFSAGFKGKIKNNFEWSVDAYFKKMKDIVDFKPGASFIYDSSFVDMLDRIEGQAYGLESSIVKKNGKLTGSISYTYSRSKREWYAPEGKIWIPSISDRPHNFNVALKYSLNNKTSFGFTFIYQSGSPATIYMHETSYGEFYETKNNIRYYDYNRLDLSLRRIFYLNKFTLFLDADIYNVYNRKNTFYFRRTYDEAEKRYYFKNISLFPIMPTLSLTIKY
jgi:hypothetical protein